MPKTLKSVCKGYDYNKNYTLSPRRFETIIKVLEDSKNNLNKANVAHIVLQVDNQDFNKSSINATLKVGLEIELNTGYGYFLAMEKSEYSGYHIHIMLTFSTGSKYAFTILRQAVTALYALNNVNTAIALPRKTDKSIPIQTRDYYKKYRNMNRGSKYFHVLNDDAELADAVKRYSYLAKNETKEEFQGNRSTQPKYPKASKTKQGQKIRVIKVKENE